MGRVFFGILRGRTAGVLPPGVRWAAKKPDSPIKNSDAMNPPSSSDGRETPEQTASTWRRANPNEVGLGGSQGGATVAEAAEQVWAGQQATRATIKPGISRQVPPAIPAGQRELRLVAEDHGAKKNKKNSGCGWSQEPDGRREVQRFFDMKVASARNAEAGSRNAEVTMAGTGL